MKTTLNTRTLEAALRDAQSHGYRSLYDPMTMLHSNIDEFIAELLNQNAPFWESDAYVRFGDIIIAVRDAWSDCGEYYELKY